MMESAQEQGFVDLLGFLRQYDTFLAKMLTDEEEKLQALVSASLPRIEHALSAAQANAKQMANMEARREDLQMRAGVPALSFTELLDLFPQELQEQAQAVFTSFSGKLDAIKFRNEKSMDFARASMRTVNLDAMPDDAPPAAKAAGNAYAKASVLKDAQSMLETKI